WSDPLITLAWAACGSERVGLGTSVIVLPLRDPLLLAKQVATLDRLAPGRAVLGVGAGWMREEFAALRIPFESRWERTREMVEVMRLAWTGRPFSYHGSFFDLEDLTMRPAPSRAPSILWGGRSERALRSAAVLGHG